MAFDYKKEYKNLYHPKKQPEIIKVPKMNYIAVSGSGDPNQEDGTYQEALGLLYGLAYTIKMSKKGEHKIPGYFDYVVPPLEGLWWSKDQQKIDYAHKENFAWISMIRLPDFVTKKEFDWAIKTATEKKKQDFSQAKFFTYDEGLCVQIMHTGSYDNEPTTIEEMHQFVKKENYQIDIQNPRYHHEIYLSDPRRTKTERLKTVIRLPIK